MIILTARLFDSAHSPLVLAEDPSSDIRTISRRLSRTATLDGGAVIDDAGFADGDRTLTVVLRSPPADTMAALQGMIEADGLQRISTRDGVFEGGMERISELSGGQLSVSFLVSQKLSG